MVLTERAEEILETLGIEIIEKEREWCDASILKDDNSLKELSDGGYVRVRDNRLNLTKRGREEAKNCIRRHRLAERLFADVLDVKGKSLHEKSCQLEHMLHKGLDDNICALLGHPTTCPHGKPIPAGTCCNGSRRALKKVVMPLTELKARRKAKVSYLQTRNRAALKKMIAMGILPNTNIRLVQKFPSYVFQLGKSQFTVDKELASNIYVRHV